MLTNIYFLLPEIYLSIISVLLLGFGVVVIKFQERYSQILKINYLTAISLIFAASMLFIQNPNETIYISNGLLIMNDSTILVKITLLISSAILLVLPNKMTDYEFSQLVLLSVLGMMILVSANDMIVIYLGIELMSLSFYVLAAINKNSQHSTEAGIKYFLLGALSSGLLLFGMALIYAYTGETNLQALNAFVWYSSSNELVLGALFIFIALLFKLAAAPFHMWLPDVYEGSPTNVTAFFAIVPKIAILVTLTNLIYFTFIGIWDSLQPLLIVCAILSLIVGSIGAINQAKIKRLLSYSAISHIGFLLIGIIPLSLYSIQATMIYILLYIVMSLNTFTILLNMSKYNYITQFSGLSRLNPVLALTFTFTLLSIAGIPPLAGFFSKYLILINAVQNDFYLLAFVAVATSAISTFYYLRLIKWFFFNDSNFFTYKNIADLTVPTTNPITINFFSSLVLGVTLWIILTFMIFPEVISTWTFISVSTSLI